MSNSRPSTAAVRSAATGRLGQPLQPAVEHVGDRGRRMLLGEQLGPVAPLPRQPGELDQEERVAVGALRAARRPAPPVSSRWATVSKTVGDLVVRQTGELDRGGRASGPVPRRPRPARRWARGAAARWRAPAAGPRPSGLDEQPQHPQASQVSAQCRSSSTTSSGRSLGGVAHARATIRSQARNWPPSSLGRRGLGEQAHADAVEHRLPRPQRRRTVVLGAAADQHPGAAATRRSDELGREPGLADARAHR